MKTAVTLLTAGLVAVLEENYPDDRAGGDEVGGRRGAFRLSKPLS